MIKLWYIRNVEYYAAGEKECTIDMCSDLDKSLRNWVIKRFNPQRSHLYDHYWNDKINGMENRSEVARGPWIREGKEAGVTVKGPHGWWKCSVSGWCPYLAWLRGWTVALQAVALGEVGWKIPGLSLYHFLQLHGSLQLSQNKKVNLDQYLWDK